jgi:hypothetical protein
VNEDSVSRQVFRDIEAVLDECLTQMNRGQSLEACVAQYPALAAELEPLLRMALRVEALREDEPPSPVALRAGRQRLLGQAALLRRTYEDQTQPTRFPWRVNLQALMRRSMVSTAVATVLLVTVLAAGTVAASARSLPGDALYPVKRASEEVRLLLTFDQQIKAQLVGKIDERRREEAQAISDRRRVAELSFRGRIQRMDGMRWTVGGVAIRTSEETVFEGDLAVHTFVRVHVRSVGDGTLLAMRISVEPEIAAPQPTASPSMAEPTKTAAVTPTETQQPTEIPPATRPAQPAAVTATPSATATRTATPSATPTEIPPTPPPPRDVKVRFSGMIETITAEAWTIGGQVVTIDENTVIDEEAAPAAVGAVARVIATRQQDGTLLGVAIIIERAAEVPEQPFEFQGLIESFGSAQWIVGGHSLLITEQTVIEGTPQKGLLAEVKAMRQSDGSLIAVRIVVRLPTEEVQFEGVIQSVGDGEWIVEDVTVRLDAETAVEGTPAVGAVAEVQGLLLPDGAVLARRIVVQSAVTGTVTPTTA